VLAVSTADNWIKPLFISGRAKVPTFPLLISILGGLSVYGFLGVFLGPVVLAILFAFVEIYREEYQRAPAASAPAEPAERRAASVPSRRGCGCSRPARRGRAPRGTGGPPSPPAWR